MIKLDNYRLDTYPQSPDSSGLSFNEQTIAALSSGVGGAVAIIRVSGSSTFNVLSRCFAQGTEFEVRKANLSQFIDPESGEVVDDLIALLFCGPASFTGENVAELHCHGGPYIVNRILSILFRLGCRHAEPGEFTRRAFLNGKLDLSSAEGINGLVTAQSHQQWKAGRQLSNGSLSDFVESLRKEMIGAMAYLEAAIDFPDEGDTKSVDVHNVSLRVQKVSQKLDELADSYDNGRIAANGLKVAIIGSPNMGKSSLLNVLLGEKRAIVTDIPGTTRDYIQESCLVNGRLISLIDTAGIRETEERVEQVGVDSSIRLSQEADLVLLVEATNATAHELQYFKDVKLQLPEDKVLQVTNKIDLKPEIDLTGSIGISCLTGVGIPELKQELARRVDGYVAKITESPFITSARHLEAVEEARSSLNAFDRGVKDGAYEEMLAFELQSACRSLGAIIGDVEHDDLLDRVFSDFCVGK